MSEAENPELSYISSLCDYCDKMNEYLHSNVNEGFMRERLKDQLIWLQYQIKYHEKSGDLELLEENYNWVAQNFNHDLHLGTKEQFEYLRIYTKGL